MIEEMVPQEVRLGLKARREIALLDLREEAPFALGHPLFASQLALSRLELEILDRVPRRQTLIVLYDDGEELVARAATILRELGYSNLRMLSGGLGGWRAAGYELFQDVNSYSKAFGELVEHRRHTPSIAAEDLRSLLEGSEDVVVMDARPFEEYEVMSIPTAISVPGAELVLRSLDVAPNPSTRIVVNCAGRTRSLIGAQSLINAGVRNPVMALRNGTIGWLLAGQDLDSGQSRAPGSLTTDALETAKAGARAVAYRCGVRHLDREDVADLEAESGRTLYKFDVRSASEYAEGHLPGFRSAPGGQLVQEIDVFAPVRGARIVVFDHLGPRADMTASWLAQMGWEAYVLDAPLSACSVAGCWTPQLPPLPRVPEVSIVELTGRLQAGEILVDFATSRLHRHGHIPGAWFAIRANLVEAIKRLPPDRPMIFTSPDGVLARWAATDATRLSIPPVAVVAGGTQAWVDAGQPLEKGLQRPANPPDDVYRRPYEGTEHSQAAMQAYLDWEFGLVQQLERDNTHGFFAV